MRLPHSGGDVLESGQSCPELGRPVRVCVPSDKPDKGLSKQGQNRKCRDRPNSASLANQEWFPDLLDLSIDFPISLPPVQKLLKQTFSHHFHPHPWLLNLHAWRLSRDSTRREDFLKRLPKGSLYLRDNPQRSFTNLSGRCLESGAMLSRLILSRATVQQLADFLIFLFEEKKLAISSIQGYRSCISKVFLAKGIDISHDRDLNMLVRNFAIERPVQHREAPRWDLMIVLRLLMKPPFEPMNMASLADMTRKLAFLLSLATAKRNSEVWAFSADVRFGQDYMQLPCRFCQISWLKRWIRVDQRPLMLLSRSRH